METVSVPIHRKMDKEDILCIYLFIYLFIYYSVIEKIINGEIYISESARSHLCVESLKTKPKINTCNKTETEL